MKRYLFGILLLTFALNSCQVFTSKPRRLYKTLVRKDPWNVAELKISLFQNENDVIPYWDTTLVDYATIQFIKGKFSDFNSDMTIKSSGQVVKLQNFISESDDELFYSMRDIHDSYYKGFGGGKPNEYKGNRITISGERHYWFPTGYNGGVYVYAPFLNESAYYECYWVFESEK